MRPTIVTSVLGFVLFSLAVPAVAVAASPPWTFVEAGYNNVNVDDINDSGSGAYLAGYFGGKNFHVFANYSSNSTDDFDIGCKNIRYTRSHIRRRSCEPKFLTRERQNNSTFAMSQWRDANRNAFGDGGGIQGIIDFSALSDYLEGGNEIIDMLSARFQEMGEDMIRVAMENPEFLNALMQVNLLNKELTALWEQRFGN